MGKEVFADVGATIYAALLQVSGVPSAAVRQAFDGQGVPLPCVLFDYQINRIVETFGSEWAHAQGILTIQVLADTEPAVRAIARPILEHFDVDDERLQGLTLASYRLYDDPNNGTRVALLTYEMKLANR